MNEIIKSSYFNKEDQRHKLDNLQRERGYDDPEVAELYYRINSRDGVDPKISNYFKDIVDRVLPEDNITVGLQDKRINDCTALDLGSGPGIMSEILQDRFGHVIAVDKAGAMVDFINHRHHEGKIEARQGDFAAEIPVSDKSVEAVFSLNTIDELAPGEEDKFLTEIARVVKPGGIAVINRVVSAENMAMKAKFKQERDREVKSYDPDFPRNYVFISSELEERVKSLVAGMGIEPEVEVINDPYDHRYCIVKIKFNYDKNNET